MLSHQHSGGATLRTQFNHGNEPVTGGTLKFVHTNNEASTPSCAVTMLTWSPCSVAIRQSQSCTVALRIRLSRTAHLGIELSARTMVVEQTVHQTLCVAYLLYHSFGLRVGTTIKWCIATIPRLTNVTLYHLTMIPKRQIWSDKYT